MNFIVDENLPPRLALWIAERGHGVSHVREAGLRTVIDPILCEAAAAQGAVIVTQDRDFDAFAERGRVRVVRLTLGNATTASLLQWLAPRWPAVETSLLDGEALIVVV